MSRFEYFEHLADMGIIGWGETLVEAFEEAAQLRDRIDRMEQGAS